MSLTPEQNLDLKNRIATVLITKLEPLFVKGMELTFIARLPGNDEADVLVTSEPDLNALSSLIERAKSRPEVKP